MIDLAEQWRKQCYNKKQGMFNDAMRGIDLNTRQQEFIYYAIISAFDGHTVETLCGIFNALRNYKEG